MAEDYRDRARKRASQRQTSIWYKTKEGDNTFRILPTPESETTSGVFFEYAVHRDVGPKKQVVRCGKDYVTQEGSCWLCDKQIPKLVSSGHKSRALAMEPKDQFAVQIAKVDDDGNMTGPFIFTPARTVADQLLSSILASKKRVYADAKKGYNITLNRTGTGKNDTRYGMLEPDTDSSEVPASLIKKLKSFADLKEIPEYSEAKQKAAYTGEELAETGDEERPKRPTSKKPTPADEEEEEEEEEEDLDEDVDSEDDDTEEGEEEPVKPVKSGKKKSVPEPEEDEEESEDEEEEEEEPEPPKKPGKDKKKPGPVDEDEEEDEAEDDEEEPTPQPKTGKGKKKPEPEPEEDEDDIDLDDESEEDEEEEPPPPKKKPSAKPTTSTAKKKK